MVEAPVGAIIDASGDSVGPQMADRLFGFSFCDEQHTIPVTLRPATECFADVAVHRLCSVAKLFFEKQPGAPSRQPNGFHGYSLSEILQREVSVGTHDTTMPLGIHRSTT